MATCAVEGCARDATAARGWCWTHYQRQRRHGNFDPPATDEQRLLEGIEVDGDCWLWTGHTNQTGHGTVSYRGKRTPAHRAMWRHLVGEIPPGLELDHLCRRPACVNPDHLDPVAHRENLMRSPVAVASINARKTHCPKGHPYTQRAGRRACLACRRAQDRSRRVGRK